MRLVLNALEQNASLSGAVIHDLLPILSRHDSKERQQSCSKALEVRMIVQLTLQLDAGEEGDAEYRE